MRPEISGPGPAAGSRYAGPMPDGADDEELLPPHQEHPPESDAIDEASEESFPASDAPSTWSREEPEE